jgi:hypothetical protein
MKGQTKPATLDSSVPQSIRDFFAGTNAFDSDAMIAPFTEDGLVNDIQREFWGHAAIKRWADKESVGDHVVTTDFTDIKEHHGNRIISVAVDGEYDKTGLPDPLILTYYFTLAGDQIASLIIVGNKPATRPMSIVVMLDAIGGGGRHRASEPATVEK